MTKIKLKNIKKMKELILLISALYYTISFLEKAGIEKEDVCFDDKGDVFTDIRSAINIKNKLIKIVCRIDEKTQQEALRLSNIAMINTGYEKEFNYLVFVVSLLTDYMEKFKNKIYNPVISYEDINAPFDEIVAMNTGDKEQMQIIKDSTDFATLFYKEITKEDEKV